MPGKSLGWRTLVGCSPWGHEESDMTERLHFHFSLSCIGEGNGNPLQCACLENPRDRGAWWAAIYGVAQSRTQLKQLSSSSRERICFPGGASGKEPACQCGRYNRGRFNPWVGKIPEKEMASHSSSLAWRIPWTEEPGWVQSVRPQRVGNAGVSIYIGK